MVLDVYQILKQVCIYFHKQTPKPMYRFSQKIILRQLMVSASFSCFEQAVHFEDRSKETE